MIGGGREARGWKCLRGFQVLECDTPRLRHILKLADLDPMEGEKVMGNGKMPVELSIGIIRQA